MAVKDFYNFKAMSTHIKNFQHRQTKSCLEQVQGNSVAVRNSKCVYIQNPPRRSNISGKYVSPFKVGAAKPQNDDSATNQV